METITLARRKLLTYLRVDEVIPLLLENLPKSVDVPSLDDAKYRIPRPLFLHCGGASSALQGRHLESTRRGAALNVIFTLSITLTTR